jgi:hypothetical protein
MKKPGIKGAPGKNMPSVKEDISDGISQDSRISKPMDGIMGGKGVDPRKK